MIRNLSLIVWIGVIGFGLFAAGRARSQDFPKDSLAASIRLSPEQLKVLEGYYSSSQNKDMVVKISAIENGLSAKLLWNNEELHLTPESAMGFVSKESGDGGPIHVVFHRDSSGHVNQLDVAKNGGWIRVNDYKPVVKREMEHTPAQLLQFEGLYQARDDISRFLQFSVRDNKLVLKQTWDGTEILFVPESELAFFTRAMPLFSLDFSKDKDGNITQVLAFKRDVWLRAAKVPITPALLKTYEGKYQSKDDPDNEIRIIATDSSLVVRQLWDKRDIPVQPLTAIYFNNLSRSFPVVIDRDEEGKVSQVVLLTGLVFKRVPE